MELESAQYQYCSTAETVFNMYNNYQEQPKEIEGPERKEKIGPQSHKYNKN